MFFNSWKDNDTEYYYDSISETGSSNYNRGYSDGYSAGKQYLSKCEMKKYDDDIDKAYNKGFKAGLELYMSKKEPLKKDALEILMDELLCAEIEAQSIIAMHKRQYISNELDFGGSDELGYSSEEPDDCIALSEGPTYILD
nr:MAG TPA: hypothetical protein [Caudoviricetes sp.]